jgi:alpha-amylase
MILMRCLHFNRTVQLMVLLLSLVLLGGCQEEPNSAEQQQAIQTSSPTTKDSESVIVKITPPPVNDEQLQTQNSEGVFYEIFVRAFYDSDGDGIGDLKGVTANS